MNRDQWIVAIAGAVPVGMLLFIVIAGFRAEKKLRKERREWEAKLLKEFVDRYMNMSEEELIDELGKAVIEETKRKTMDEDVLRELRQAYIEEWISREDLMDAFQRKLIEWSEYLWLVGSPEETCKLIIDNEE